MASQVLGSEQGSIIFTSGTTEAIQTAVLSALCWLREHRPDEDVTRFFAPSLVVRRRPNTRPVPEALAHWNQVLGLDHEIVAIPVNRHGQLDLQFLQDHLPKADMVCTMAVNNETESFTTCPRSRPSSAPAKGISAVVCGLRAGGRQSGPASGTDRYRLRRGQRPQDPCPQRSRTALRPPGRSSDPADCRRWTGAVRDFGTENLPGVAALGTVFEHLGDETSTAFRSLDELHAYREQLIARSQKGLFQRFCSILPLSAPYPPRSIFP